MTASATIAKSYQAPKAHLNVLLLKPVLTCCGTEMRLMLTVEVKINLCWYENKAAHKQATALSVRITKAAATTQTAGKVL
jgi:hypothetical protein